MNHQKQLKHELLYQVLQDHRWHSTAELVRLVGHTFGGAKFKLVAYGHVIRKRRHPSRAHHWQYRMIYDAPDPVRYIRRTG